MFTIGVPEYKKKRSGVAEASPLSSCGCFLGIFKTGSIIGVIKEQVSLFPKAIPHFRAKAFVNNAPHCALHRRTQRLSLFFQHFYHKPILSLDDFCPLFRPRFDSRALIGSQTVLPLVVMDGTDHPVKRTCFRTGMVAMASIKPVVSGFLQLHWVHKYLSGKDRPRSVSIYPNPPEKSKVSRFKVSIPSRRCPILTTP